MLKRTLKEIRKFHNDENGDIVQTSIIIGIFAIVAVGALVFVGPKVKAMFDRAGDSLDDGAGYSY